MTVAVGEGDELARLWRTVDKLSADLPAADRTAVYNVIATDILHGRPPDTTDIANLVAFAAGTISMAEYLTRLMRPTTDTAKYT